MIAKGAMGGQRKEKWMRVELEETDETDTTEYHRSQLHHLKNVLHAGAIRGGKKPGDGEDAKSTGCLYTSHTIQKVLEYVGANTFQIEQGGARRNLSAKLFFEVRNMVPGPHDKH